MPFRPRKKQPQFADLKGILAQYRQPDNALYQTVEIIIERLTQWQLVLNEELADKLDDEDATGFAPNTATFITESDETSTLPNSFQLIAGTNITFDTSTPNQLEINSSGGGASDTYDSPLTDGNLDETDLIFADGECIIVQVPNP